MDGRKGTSGSGAFRFRCDLTPAGSGSEVRMVGELTLPMGIRGLMVRLLFGSFRKACRRDLEALGARAEAATRAA